MGGGHLWDSLPVGRNLLPADPAEGTEESTLTSGDQHFSRGPRGMEKATVLNVKVAGHQESRFVDV
jgi:hypothetical protein